MRTIIRTLLRVMAALALAPVAACGDNEEPSLTDHTPTTASLMVNGQTVTAPHTFVAGQTVRVRIKFLNASEQDLDPVEDSHFGGLLFEPATLATVVRVADHNFQFDVTGGTAGSGTVRVGYGHDDAADEHTLDPEAVTVTGP